MEDKLGNIVEFSHLVAPSLLNKSGRVFYSGSRAFSRQSQLYVLGLNPGGSPEQQLNNTIKKDIEAISSRPEDWSAYEDESWEGKPKGAHGMQPRVRHLFNKIGLNPCNVPSSNVVFVRSARIEQLKKELPDLLDVCWPIHQAVISHLGIRAIVCMGKVAGTWVRKKIGANELIDSFVETNNRRWLSTTHRSVVGLKVCTLTHPSTANWCSSAADPTALVSRALET